MDKLIKELKHQKIIHGLKNKITWREKRLLKKNMPIQKIIGFIKFDDIKIKINKKVFIPRYETEELVHIALKYIKNSQTKVLDLGCGSGYIGLTIKKKSNAQVTTSDFDNLAIKQTKINSKINNLKIEIIKSNLFNNIQKKYDIIISNPPYVPKRNKLPISILRYEPHSAIFGGEDGNDFYKKIISQVDNYLNPQGFLIFEIGPENVFYLLKKNFSILKDINGKQRFAIKKYPINNNN